MVMPTGQRSRRASPPGPRPAAAVAAVPPQAPAPGPSAAASAGDGDQRQPWINVKGVRQLRDVQREVPGGESLSRTKAMTRPSSTRPRLPPRWWRPSPPCRRRIPRRSEGEAGLPCRCKARTHHPATGGGRSGRSGGQPPQPLGQAEAGPPPAMTFQRAVQLSIC